MMMGSLREEILEYNKDAMAALALGDVEDSKEWLDRALALLSTEVKTRNGQHEKGYRDTPDELSDSQSRHQNRDLASLLMITHNNVASWWKVQGDVASALKSLSLALSEGGAVGGASNKDLATTHSNLAATLSQMGRHTLALEYARAAVSHCRSALDEADKGGGSSASAGLVEKATEASGDAIEGQKSDSVGEVMCTLAVACHNLAVEVEFVHGVGASCVKWYAQAAAFANQAASLSRPSGDEQDPESENSGGDANGAGGRAWALARRLEEALASARRKLAKRPKAASQEDEEGSGGASGGADDDARRSPRRAAAGSGLAAVQSVRPVSAPQSRKQPPAAAAVGRPASASASRGRGRMSRGVAELDETRLAMTRGDAVGAGWAPAARGAGRRRGGGGVQVVVTRVAANNKDRPKHSRRDRGAGGVDGNGEEEAVADLLTPRFFDGDGGLPGEGSEGGDEEEIHENNTVARRDFDFGAFWDPGGGAGRGKANAETPLGGASGRGGGDPLWSGLGDHQHQPEHFPRSAGDNEYGGENEEKAAAAAARSQSSPSRHAQLLPHSGAEAASLPSPLSPARDSGGGGGGGRASSSPVRRRVVVGSGRRRRKSSPPRPPIASPLAPHSAAAKQSPWDLPPPTFRRHHPYLESPAAAATEAAAAGAAGAQWVRSANTMSRGNVLSQATQHRAMRPPHGAGKVKKGRSNKKADREGRVAFSSLGKFMKASGQHGGEDDDDIFDEDFMERRANGRLAGVAGGVAWNSSFGMPLQMQLQHARRAQGGAWSWGGKAGGGGGGGCGESGYYEELLAGLQECDAKLAQNRALAAYFGRRLDPTEAAPALPGVAPELERVAALQHLAQPAAPAGQQPGRHGDRNEAVASPGRGGRRRGGVRTGGGLGGRQRIGHERSGLRRSPTRAKANTGNQRGQPAGEVKRSGRGNSAAKASGGEERQQPLSPSARRAFISHQLRLGSGSDRSGGCTGGSSRGGGGGRGAHSPSRLERDRMVLAYEAAKSDALAALLLDQACAPNGPASSSSSSSCMMSPEARAEVRAWQFAHNHEAPAAAAAAAPAAAAAASASGAAADASVDGPSGEAGHESSFPTASHHSLPSASDVVGACEGEHLAAASSGPGQADSYDPKVGESECREEKEEEDDDDDDDDDDEYGDDFEHTTAEGSANPKESFKHSEEADGGEGSASGSARDGVAGTKRSTEERRSGEPSEYVGRGVVKLFEVSGAMEPFAGKVVAWRRSNENDEDEETGGGVVYTVEYEDGDEEDLSADELQAILTPQISVEQRVEQEKDGEMEGGKEAAEANEKQNHPYTPDRHSSPTAAPSKKSGEGPSIDKGNDNDDDEEEEEEEGASDESPPDDDDDAARVSTPPRTELATSQSMSAFTPAPEPISELSIEEMMIANLQRQIAAAISSGDLNKAAELNAKLAVLEENLIR